VLMHSSGQRDETNRLVTNLETARRRDPARRDSAFETMAGPAPMGDKLHYTREPQTR